MNAHDSDRSLSCCVNPFEHLDVAQQVDELLFLHTNIRLRHQRNKVPLHLLGDYNVGLFVTAHNCSGFGISSGTLRHGGRLRIFRLQCDPPLRRH